MYNLQATQQYPLRFALLNDCTGELLLLFRSVFDLPLELKDKKTTALRITLPPHFPQVSDKQQLQ
jgi:hypothetical protein